jgi:hypothetical protein
VTDLTIRSHPSAGARHVLPGGQHLIRRLIAVGVVLVVAAVGVYIATRSDEFDYRFATARTENVKGGYAFSYPPSWDLTRMGSASKLVAPDDTVVVSLGVGPKGGVEGAANALVVQIQGTYHGVRVLGSQPQMIGGAQALAVSGTGKNDVGVGLRFLAIALQGPGGKTFAITAFTLMNANPRRILPVLNEIVESVRPL